MFYITTILLSYASWIMVFVGYKYNQTQSLKLEIPFNFIIGIPIGIMLVIISNYTGIIKQNRYLGIKIKPTLNSEVIWKKTHRFAGATGVIGGIIVIIASIISGIINNFWIFFIGLFLGIILYGVIPTIYAYNCKDKE